MDSFWGTFPSSTAVSGTSELFSSSVAMLGDGFQPYQDVWSDQPKQIIPVNFSPFFEQPSEVIPISQETPIDYGNVTHMEQQAIYTNAYENTITLPMYSAEQMAQVQLVACHQAAQQELASAAVEEARQKEQYFAQKIVDSGITGMSPAPISAITIPINPHHTPGNDSGISMITPSRRPSSVCGSDVPGRSPVTSSESGIENDGSPGGSEVNPSDMEETNEGRVMCHACKGLYPSRRSLTGHIGRNEKCREIIGRTYLDQVAAGAIPITIPDTNLRASAMTNGQDGLSPICPHCDKFISHYKLQGNIRRHINTCGKSGTIRKSRPDRERERKRRRRTEEVPQPVLQEGFEPSPPTFNQMMYNHPQQPMPSYAPIPMSEEHQHMLQLTNQANMQIPAEPTPPNQSKRDEPPDDAYICGLCDFVTIYKGNMKRHLNTCHKSNDCKDLKEWDRKLESMRASALGMSRDEMLQRLHQHRLNSTRGRKPGKRTTQDNLTSQHLHPQMQQMPAQLGQVPMNQAQQYTGSHQQNLLSPQGMNLHLQHHEQMVIPGHLSMGMHPQEPDLYSMPQMHYGYDMGGYI